MLKTLKAEWIYDEELMCYTCSYCGNGEKYATKYCCDCGCEMSIKSNDEKEKE